MLRPSWGTAVRDYLLEFEAPSASHWLPELG
jgi:hypothetical protein